MLPFTLWRMSSGLGPRSRSRLVGSERPVSACTVSCVRSGVLSSPLPNEYCTLNERPCVSRCVALIVTDLNVESPIDCTWLITLKRGSRRVAAVDVVLNTGRPSASVRIGLIGLMLVTTGRSLPLAYMTLTDALRLRLIARSSWALVCHVCAATNSGSTAHGDCGGTVPVDTEPGKPGAPAAVLANVKIGARGDPDSCSACSYGPRIGWSYMMPVLARSTVWSSNDHAT